MSREVAVLGVDIGTSSSKGVLVARDGRILASASREHAVQRPQPGWVEMDAEIWSDEFVEIVRELLDGHDVAIQAVGVSGMGPCVCVTDAAGVPLRPAILYGVDTRAVVQIERLARELGAEEIVARCGSALSTQAVGPKLEWIADNEPELAQRARRLFMPSSWLAFRLTGEYVLDHHSASQAVPLYDSAARSWYEPWVQRIAPSIDLPRLLWPGEVAGRVTSDAAELTGIPVGTPVIAGTIDAWSEAVSVGAYEVGDLMLMYGTTMFLVDTVGVRTPSAVLWGTAGAFPGSYSLAGGMATSGAITSWLRELAGGVGYPTLLEEAEASGPGARGILMLPYFAGERTPIADPDARGTIIGLRIDHGRGDLYRAALEATAFGVRHNVEALRGLGAPIERVLAVGGGTQGGLWTQIVSDVTGLDQQLPSVTIGASFGAAFLAASVDDAPSIADWNPPAEIVRARPELKSLYEERFGLYRELYERTADIAHRLAAAGR